MAEVAKGLENTDDWEVRLSLSYSARDCFD